MCQAQPKAKRGILGMLKYPSNCWHLLLVNNLLRLADEWIRCIWDWQSYSAGEMSLSELIYSVLQNIADPIVNILPMWMFGTIVSDFCKRCRNFGANLQRPPPDSHGSPKFLSPRQQIEEADDLLTCFRQIKQSSGFGLFLVFSCFTLNVVTYAFIGNLLFGIKRLKTEGVSFMQVRIARGENPTGEKNGQQRKNGKIEEF